MDLEKIWKFRQAQRSDTGFLDWTVSDKDISPVDPEIKEKITAFWNAHMKDKR